ncbi:bifunctional glycosyltransferase/class I SAM-dependent methyltransferase [Anaerovibrio sp.]|uniref:bifunctional glycosyltransferase/class I SAM-dependent methyltransferase n=1 Tax=Anaerovibrio sp. TaxID=1872532 RepID=UPI00260CF3A6|nr:bifunctional glycosyltransferase/class I SAM-dependent methyltransferase [Anaerovibrio sp.]
MSQNTYVSVVLFVHDDIAQLEKCLCHLLDYTPAQAYELILVENMPCRAVHEYIRQLPNIQIVAYEESMTAGERWQRAAGMATGEYIIFLRDYVMVAEGWLAQLKDIFVRFPEAAVVQPSAENIDEACGKAMHIYLNCFMVDRQELTAIGGFDSGYCTERYCLNDLAVRILQRKKQLFDLGRGWLPAYGEIKPPVPKEQEIAADAARYRQKHGFSWDYSSGLRDDMLQFMDYRQPGVRVMEIGCACGATLLKIRNSNPSADLRGLELNEAAADIAANFARVESGNFEVWARPELDGKFDYIIMGDVLEHLVDTDGALQKVRSWLKPSGCLVLSIPNVSHLTVLANVLQGHWDYEEAGILDRTHVRFFTMQSIQRCLEKNGFQLRQTGRKVFELGSGWDKVREELLQLKALKVKKEDLETYQIICVAEKRCVHE